MAAVGFGRYARADYDLGVQKDVRIPQSIRSLAVHFELTGKNVVTATVQPPAAGDLRIIMRQRGKDGRMLRSWLGGPPNGTPVGKVLALQATQAGKNIPIEINYDKIIWSGLSWAAGEIHHADLNPDLPLTIRCSSAEKDLVTIGCEVFVVQ